MIKNIFTALFLSILPLYAEQNTLDSEVIKKGDLFDLLIILVFVFLIILVSIFYFSYRKVEKEKKENERLYKELQKSSRELFLFKKAIDNVSVGVTISDMRSEDNGIIYVNKRFEELTGYKKDDVLGKNLRLLQNDDKLQESISIMRGAIQKGESCKVELRNYKKDGDMFFNFVTLSPIYNQEGDLTNYVGIQHDMTEQRQKEKLIGEQNKLAAMGEMIKNIAHHWRQPLSVISTASTSISMEKELGILDDEALHQRCKQIDDTAQYLSKIIDDFQEFSDSDGSFERFDLKSDTKHFLSLIDTAVDEYNIHILLDLKEDIDLNGYPNQLNQCFMIIFNNAKDALLQNCSEDERFILISQDIKDDNVIIKFHDNGGGIDETIISKIYEPYFTTKHQSQGTGLGLYMAYTIINNYMKGDISARNLPLKVGNKNYMGAELTISIPK